MEREDRIEHLENLLETLEDNLETASMDDNFRAVERLAMEIRSTLYSLKEEAES